jgi:hypothetical protein
MKNLERVGKDFWRDFSGFSRRPRESSHCRTNLAICDERIRAGANEFMPSVGMRVDDDVERSG